MHQASKELTGKIESKAKPWSKAGKAILQQQISCDTARRTVLSLTKEKRHIQPQNWLDKLLVSESAVKCPGKIMSCNRGLSCWSTRSEEERCKTTYYLCCLHLKLRINTSDIAKLWNSAQHAASCTPNTISKEESKTSYQFLSGTRLHVVGIWICVLQGVTTLLGSGRERKERQESQTWKSAQSHLCDLQRLRSHFLTRKTGRFIVEFPTPSLEELVQLNMTSYRGHFQMIFG